MVFKFNRKQKGGFSLLELTIVLIIATILTSAVIPQLINGYTIKAANKTALDISAIQEASRVYYIKYNTWPGLVSGNAIADLTAGGYLPPSWQAINPFGFSSATPSNFNYNFTLNGTTPGASLTIFTYVPNTNAQTIIENLLPLSGVDKTTNMVFSTVTVPGTQSNTLPSGSIVAWPATSTPEGFLLCDGSIYSSSSYPNLAALLNSGNGAPTFAVPDLRGRTIVGLNTLTINDGTSRVWSTDNYSNNLGQAAPYNVNVIGAVFGEEKHRQTLVEMAPHAHQETFNHIGYNAGGSTNAMGTGGSLPTGGYTLSAGGNGDGAGLGAAANVVPPSVTMTYIIKT